MQNKPLDGICILIVEDAADVAFDVSEGLRLAGARSVEVKASVRQAKKRLMHEPVPDVALLDFNVVGDETGIDLALWMREQPALQHTLRISYSASDPVMLQIKLPDTTLYHRIITKPVPLMKLIEQVAEMISAHLVGRSES